MDGGAVNIQKKLTKEEWETIEIPLPSEELSILKFISNGFNNINTRINRVNTILSFSKLNNDTETHLYIYKKYFKDIIKTHKTSFDNKSKKLTPLKKSDIIRINNIDSKINKHKETLYEFMILNLIGKLLKSKQWNKYMFTIYKFRNFAIKEKNIFVENYCTYIWNLFQDKLDLKNLVFNSPDIIEKNIFLSGKSDTELFDHQKKLFSLFKQKSPKCVLYSAPTGTGKTLTPIGLTSRYRVIFVCASRHVCLSLARSCISVNKKIALAFNCNDANDVRLHYFAAKEYEKNYKTGGIFKVDNSVGDNVEIIISDIHSYQHAMYYMLAFNEKDNIITYLDEPTISLDYASHTSHDIIKNNWCNNIIPNIILSSATLPDIKDIPDTIYSYKNKFEGDVFSIQSHMYSKSIPLIDRGGFVYLPHLTESYTELIKKNDFCSKNKTMLRYIDLCEITKFIIYINENSQFLKNQYILVENYFDSIDMINMEDIKKYYLVLIQNIKPLQWPTIYEECTKKRQIKLQSSIYISTSDAHTLTDGPSIYITDSIEKIATFILQEAKIPDCVIDKINDTIYSNNRINKEILKLYKVFEECTSENESKQIKTKIDALQSKIKNTNLNDIYIPNRKQHIFRHTGKLHIPGAFTPEISDADVIELMRIKNIDNKWKILFMMGIGVFTNTKNTKYSELLKKLAYNKKLFIIIATSDYIYGTNYQFCHGYIGKDMHKLTREKLMQAIGRIGRNNIQQEFSVRFRDTNIIDRLFSESDEKIEASNMNKLFNI